MIGKAFRPYTRDEIVESIRRLPENATVDDAIERLTFLRHIEIARDQIDAGDSFTQEEIEREMTEWRD